MHARQIDLKPSFLSARALCKDIKNDLLSVDHRHIGEFFPVTLLHGRDLIVEYHAVATSSTGQFNKLICLARSTDKPLVGIANPYQFNPRHPDLERIDEFFQLGQEQLSLRLLRFIKTKTNKHGLLDHLRLFSYFKHRRWGERKL